MSLADWKIDSLNEGLNGQNNIRSLSQKKIKNREHQSLVFPVFD